VEEASDPAWESANADAQILGVNLLTGQHLRSQLHLLVCEVEIRALPEEQTRFHAEWMGNARATLARGWNCG
jgi:hypothetical protein